MEHDHCEKIRNKAFLEVGMCNGEKVVLETREVEAEKIDICFEKEQSCDVVFVGGILTYSVKIGNHCNKEVHNLIFKDHFDHDTEYVHDSFTVNGIHVHPEIHDHEIMLKIAELKGHSEYFISFKVKVRE